MDSRKELAWIRPCRSTYNNISNKISEQSPLIKIKNCGTVIIIIIIIYVFNKYGIKKKQH